MMMSSSSSSKEAVNRDYEIGAELGRGRFGTVYICTSRSTGESFALKTVDKTLIDDPFDLSCVLNEPKLTRLAAGSVADSSNVVNVHGVYEDPVSLHLILDLCSGPDLFDVISERGPLPEPEAAAILAQLMCAVAGCHRRGVAHRDIKPDNVLFDCGGSLRLKLSDFGSAACFGEEYSGCCRRRVMSGLVGTPHYVAPEVVRGEEYGEGVDVWSCGVVMYVMLSGAHPFGGETVGEVFEAVARGNLRFPTSLFGGLSREAKDLMRKMMCRDPSRRLSAEQVLRHPWVKNGGVVG